MQAGVPPSSSPLRPFGEEERKQPDPLPSSSSPMHVFVVWLSNFFSDQSNQEISASSLKEKHDITTTKSIDEVLVNALKVSSDLKLLKERLVEEFGVSAQSFIAKSIDPMILHSKQLVEELIFRQEEQERSGGESSLSQDDEDVLKHAIESVELYSQFGDETKLINKIIQESIESTHQAIGKDVHILHNYSAHLVREALLASSNQGLLEEKLKEKLDPIFTEFAGLYKKECTTKDLREFFLWKYDIDEKRNALTELGLLTIDSVLSPAIKRSVAEVLTQDFSKDEKVFREVDSKIIETSIHSAQIEVFKERVEALFEQVHENKVFQTDEVIDLEQRFAELKMESAKFEKEKNTPIEPIFSGAQEKMKSIEARLVDLLRFS